MDASMQVPNFEPTGASGEKVFDRARDDVGNILLLDHLNLAIDDQLLATTFYIEGLGLTRDPYLRVGIFNMGVNIGRSQFHLPTAGSPASHGAVRAQCVPGTTGVVILGLEQLAQRLKKISPLLKGTQFSYQVSGDH